MDVNQAVATNLKAIRERKKLSLDQLSQLTGVSKSMLGQIERGEVNPTISVLWKIANGLKISFSTLIERHQGEFTVVRAEDVTPLIEDGGYINYPMFPFDERTRVEQYRIEIKSGGKLSAQPHFAGTEEYIIVFKGEVEISLGGVTTKLGKGDAMRFVADVPHEYANSGSKTAALCMTLYYAP